MTSRTTIHALLVGINEFKYQSSLKACVNDVNAMADYLKNQIGTKENLKIRCLFDEEATKAGIIHAFKEHLIQAAKEGDIALFYFSGHGGQEEVPEVFRKYEADNLIDGIICHDTGRGEGERSLADKELRYLFHKLSLKKCDIVTIFDCCHSGDSIRDESLLRPKRLTRPAKERKWEEFIFSQDPLLADPNIFNEKNLDELIPPVKHIHMAACQDSELAYEHPKHVHGLFTHHLIEELKKSKSNISYIGLQRRLLHQMNLKKYKQNPQIFAHRAYHGEIFNAFLGGVGVESLDPNISSNQHLITGQLGYDQYKRKWLINLGGIHGLVAAPDETQMVSIMDEDGRQVSAKITKVETASSELELIDNHGLNKRKQYDAIIGGMMLDPVYICFTGEEAGISVAKAYAESNRELLQAYNIFFTDQLQHATYQLIAQDGKYAIAYPWDDRPLIKQIPGYSDYSMRIVMGKFKHIAQWVFTKNLKPSGNGSILKQPIQLTLHSSNGEKIIVDSEKGPTYLKYFDPNSVEKNLKYAFQFQNCTNEGLYIACLYLDRLFQVEVNYLQPNVVFLEAEAETWAISGKYVPLRLPAYIREFNWPEEPLYFKVIASTQPFDVNMLALPSLKSPTRQELVNQVVKEFQDKKNEAEASQWTTQMFEFRVENPHYHPK